MEEPRWEFFPLLAEQEQPRKWLQIQANLGLAENTIQAYGKSLEDYLLFCKIYKVVPELAKKPDIANYVRYLAIHPNPRGRNVVTLDSGVGLANATMQLRITAIRLFYDHLIEESIRQDNPVGRGKYTPGKGFAGCGFYIPKGSSKAQIIEAKGNLERMLQEIPLTEDEQFAVTEGIEALTKLKAKLSDVPTPSGQTPKQLEEERKNA